MGQCKSKSIVIIIIILLVRRKRDRRDVYVCIYMPYTLARHQCLLEIRLPDKSADGRSGRSSP